MTPEQRYKLQQDYVDSIVHDMDIKTLCDFAYESISCTLDDYSTDELITEINQSCYPHLLENVQDSN